MPKMTITTEKINGLLSKKSISRQKLIKLLKKDEGYISHIFKGDQAFSKIIIKKLLPILEIPQEEFESWVIADKYPKEILELAVKNKKNFNYKRKSMLTVNIDKLLKEKGISRTTLSKQINYDQSSLNRIITRKASMSEPVLERISDFFELSQNEILSWIVVDKYSLEVLEKALLCKLENPESSHK